MTDLPKIEFSDDGRIIYEPDGEVLCRYLEDRRHVSLIRGAIGSGTSVASCMKLYMISMEQRKGLDGKRRTRWGVVRNTYGDLRETTVKTWLEWFPEKVYGTFTWSRPMNHAVRIGDVEMDLFFLALDDDNDVKKLRSLEVTGWWLNEVEFQPKSIFDECESRTGRFPPMKDGGCSWDGVIADMNAPEEDCWIVQMTGEAPLPDEMSDDEKRAMRWPDDWGYHVQPPALVEVFEADGKTVKDYVVNPKAENTKWLKPGFYEEKRRGKSKKWIDSRLMNRITFVMSGDPVWPNFKPDLHYTRAPLGFNDRYEVFVALDFGRRPTALIAQDIGGKIQCQRELRMYGVSASVFAPALKRFLEQNYRGAKVHFTGDPKGRDHTQAGELTAYDVFESYGMTVTPAPVRNNNLDDRLEAVSYALETYRILVGSECSTLYAAMCGKYHLKKLMEGDAQPLKDKYSDIADCLQYLCLYLGEGRRMIGISGTKKAVRSNIAKPMRSLRRVA